MLSWWKKTRKQTLEQMMSPTDIADSVVSQLDELISLETNRARHIRLMQIRAKAQELAAALAGA